jgi:DNA-binding GntR family transcriptional regulator
VPVSEVYCQLLSRILVGDVPPGSALQENTLAAEFKVSRTPIREALIRLEADGLVRIVPKQGVYVTEITHQTYRNAFEVRYHMISIAGQLVAQRIADREVSKLREIAAETQALTEPREIKLKDMEFHTHLNCATHNPMLAESLRRLSYFMPRLETLTPADYEYFRSIGDNLAEIVEAVDARDGTRTASLLQAHITKYREHINKLPEIIEPAAV